MKRSHVLLPVFVTALVTWTLTTAIQAQSAIPVYAFVQDSTGQVWIVGKTARVAIPIYAATDEQIAGIPWNGQWMVPTDAGIGPGARPSWSTAEPTLPSGAATTEVAPAPTAAATATTAPAQAAPAPTATQAPVATAEDPVKLSGERAQNTKVFALKGGRYTATWETKLRRGQTSCYTSARIYRASDKRLLETVYSTTLSERERQTSASGETQIYGVPAGEYYLDVEETGCSWSVTITPQ